MKTLTYEEWLKVHGVRRKFEECYVCEGDGVHTCNCADTHDCHECGGTGKIDLTRLEYDEQVQRDMELLKDYKGGVGEIPKDSLTDMA